MGDIGEYFARDPFTFEGGRAQPPLESYEQWARDISGLCGRRCESEHTGSGHGKSTLCINDIGHEGPHLCDRGELERGDAG